MVLVDHCRKAEEIDVAEAESERVRAEAELKDLGGRPEDEAKREEIEEELALANAQIEVGARAAR